MYTVITKLHYELEKDDFEDRYLKIKSKKR